MNTLLLGGNTRVVMGEIKPYYWSVQPMYLSFRDLVAKTKANNPSEYGPPCW